MGDAPNQIPTLLSLNPCHPEPRSIPPTMNGTFSNITSPKRGASAVSREQTWYNFYAMYAADFVRGVFNRISLPQGAVVLDPWNGTGTTTLIARQRGFRSVGIDANPAMFVIAKARLVPRKVAQKIAHGLEDLETKIKIATPALDDEPLLRWFNPKSAASIRAIENALCKFAGTSRMRDDPISQITDSTALCYVALFRAIRTLLTPFRTSNPTWIKESESWRRRLRPSLTSILACLRKEMEHLVSLSEDSTLLEACADVPQITIGTSASIPLESGCIALTITSPPYCTRIDYIQATLPELALLGFSRNRIRELRETMLGSPVITDDESPSEAGLGPTATTLLRDIKQHKSRASSSYYYKTYAQYFHMLLASLNEISRVSLSGAHSVFVVQDSFYKNIHINLPAVFKEMLEARDWTLRETTRFETTTLGAIHPHSSKYRSNTDAVESVLVFRKNSLR